MRKLVVWIIVIAVVLLVGYRVFQRMGQRRASFSTEEERRVPVRVSEVAMSSLREVISFTGDVKGKDQVNVYSEVPGRIREYAVSEGNWVRKEGLLATVDRAITGLDFEPAKVRSPIAGIVGRIYLDKGDAVAPQVPVALVVRMDVVEVKINVVEKDVPKIREGQVAGIRVDAYPDTSFTGKVTSVSPVVDPMSRTAAAKISLTNRKGLLKPGMFARVDLVVREKTGVVVVPADAVLGRAEYYVFVVEGGKAAKRKVSLGIREKNSVEVTEGLQVGDSLIVVGQRVVDLGEEVAVVGE
jgi:multidrug efflux pump subunit AcrA (membrane-fusion protein)